MNRVLVLGNDPLQSSTLLDCLVQAGIERGAVNFVNCLTELIEAATITYPTLVVLNLSIFEITSMELCSQIKALPKLQRSTLVIVGNDGRMQTFRQAFEVGADYYIPLNNSTVKNLARLLDKIKAENETANRFAISSPALQFSIN